MNRATRVRKQNRVLQQAVERLECRRLLTTYYVDNNPGDNGSNTNTGTSLTAPFLTIQQAATVAEPGDTVDIVGGTYREEVVPAHSGTASAPITYQPYNNEKVVVSGANLVTGWTQYSGDIYQSSSMTWTMGGQDDQLFVDGQMMNYARWPNTSLDVSSPNWEIAGPNTSGYQTSSGTLSETVYDQNLTQPAGYWNGATIHIETGDTWIYEAATITSYTRTVVNGVSYGVINYTSSYTYPGYYLVGAGDPFYITGDPYFTAGSFQNLDSAGEFYRDPNTGKVYLWTPAGDSPASHVIEAKAREWAFDLSGLSYINLNGINIFAAGINSSATSSHLTFNGITAQYVSQFENYTGNWAPTLLNGTPVIGGTGIVLDGNYDTIENSTVAYSAGEGVYLGGSDETVYNNVIHDVDYAGLNCAAITTSENATTLSANDSISFNTLYDSGRTLIEASAVTASKIDNNRLWNSMLQTGDGGAIYAFAGNGGGTEIYDNVISNSVNNIAGFDSCGIFLDGYSTGFTVDHNLIYDATEGIKTYLTYANNIINNTIDNTQISINLSTYTATGLVVNNITNNAIYLPFGTGSMTVSHNLQGSSNTLFVSPSTGNYQLQSGSAAINAGLVEAPYTNGYVGSAPDEGAYEYGAAAWSAGASNTAAVQSSLAVPSPWTSGDIGSPPITGNSNYSNGVFAISGSGSDIWGSSDQFQFADVAVSGNQTIVARVASQTNTNAWAKAGVMFRSTSAANSPFVMVVQTPGSGVNLMWRDASGNLNFQTAATVLDPAWVKLVRNGNVFTGYDSTDGINWTTIGSVTIALPASGLIGLAVSSHDTTLISTATFDNVSLTWPAPTGLTATVNASGSINLNWNAATGATGYQIQRSTDDVNFSTIASVGAVTSYTDSNGVTAGTQYYYRLIYVTPFGSSPASSVASASKPPLAPTGVSAAASVIQTTVSWNPVSGAASYDVYRSTTSGGEGSTPIATGVTGSTYSDTNVRTDVTYYYEVTAVSSTGVQSALSSEASVSAGVVSAVPGVILAINYDLGGEGVAYHDSDSVNQGGAYRNDGVDIEASSSGGYDVGWVLPGEWLNYTISVPSTGYYAFSTLTASPESGGTFQINIDGADVSGSLTVPNTGGWQNYTTVTSGPVLMTAGIHVMRLAFDTAPGGNVGNFKSITVATSSAPAPTVPSGLTASAGAGSIALNWTAGANDATFNLYRATTSGGEGTTPLVTGITSTSYVDTTATAGTKYYYTVTGVNGTKASGAANESVQSSEVSATSLITTVLDGSFETTSVNGSYTYDPTTAYWKFTGNAGIEANGSAWNAAAAPDGTQAAFLQTLNNTSGGSVSQTLSFADEGTFEFTFYAAQRPGYGVQPIVVSVDGSVLTTITPGSTSFQSYTTPAISLNPGSHVLTFSTTAVSAVDAASFIDKVSDIVVSTAPGAPTSVTAVAGVSQVSLSWTAAFGAVTYNVYRGSTSGGESSTPIATGVTGTSFVDTGASPGANYYYVTAFNGNAAPFNSQSAASTEVSANVTIYKLTGTPIGTPGISSSYSLAQAFDGNLSTFYYAPDSSLSDWVGLNLGSPQTITQIRYAPRAGFEFQMYGGQFQASTTPDFSSNVVTLYTINAIPVAGQSTTVSVNPGAAYQYVRYVGGNQWVDIAEMEVDGYGAPAPVSAKLTGTPIGTAGISSSYSLAQAFDGNFSTFYYAPDSSLTDWVGLDLGSPQTITQIRYAPRAGFEFQMYGGQFQASSTPDFSSNVITLYTINAIPTAGQFTTVAVSSGGAYRYVRYVGGNVQVDVAELEFDGYGTTAPASSQLTGTAIGTAGISSSYSLAQAFDGNLSTFYYAPDSNLTDWVGLNLGSQKTITSISFAPRAGWEWEMYGGEFQVSNTADFSSGVVTIYTVSSIPASGQLTTVQVSVPGTYQYIRFVGGTQWVDIAEMEVSGY
jgi:fibronectin type 3 domain-containing protein